MQAIFETIVHISYLTLLITLGMIMVKKAGDNKQFKLYGIMAVALATGDSFHLLPRIVALNTTGLQNYPVSLGLGKLVTSITMTVFYILMYHIWRERYKVKDKDNLTVFFYMLAGVRVVLALYPQNEWTSLTPSVAWGVYRNIPFVIMGLIIIALYYSSAKEHNDKPFRLLWLAVVISFGCYIPVVLWADAYPIVGFLMIPKTAAYAWAVWMGYSAMRKSQKSVKA